jgi:hypothetical protein
MPYVNEHAARIESPGKYSKFRRRNIAPGIDVIFGVTGEGKAEVQAYRFAKEKYTPAEAKAWLEKHNVKPMMFENAKSE